MNLVVFRRERSSGRGDRGSLFVEAMVAAAVVAIALGSTFNTVVENAHRARALESRRMALLVAQSQLAATGTAIPLRGGETAGEAGPFQWRVEISPYSDGVSENTGASLWRVTVAVSSRDGGPDLATLDTLRVGSPAA